MSFRDDQTRKLRLSLLRLLGEAGDDGANSFVLHQAAISAGFRETRDRVRGELDWLAQQRLVTLVDVGGPAVAALTERGRDVAQGFDAHHGVELFVPGA